jgi:TPR repeat protein
MLKGITLIPAILMMAALTSCQKPTKNAPVQTATQNLDTLKKQAANGDANAQKNLGYAFDLGRGVPQDYEQAAVWYRRAAEQGNAKAQFNLGLLYYNGQGVQQDYAQAAVWDRRAAEQGFIDAQFNLGLSYYHGQGVSQDYAQAAVWWRKAAEQGDAQAQYNLGLLYHEGQGVPKDNAQAILWTRKAAEQGYARAQINLDVMQSEEKDAESAKFTSKLHSYWSTRIRVDTDMDSFWLPDEERTCQTYPSDKGKVAVVACNVSGSHRDHNIPVTFWGDPDRNTVSDWRCRREQSILGGEFVCRAID